MNRPLANQRAFTLVELMVVMAILGVLAAAVAVYARPDPRAIDAASLMADAVREAARRAFSLGPVRADLADRHRTEVRIIGNNVVIDELVEGALAGTSAWVRVRTKPVITRPRRSDFVGWGAVAQIDDNPNNPPAMNTDMTGFLVRCFPNGTCDPATVYFGEWRLDRYADPAPPPFAYARTIVVPLGGAVIARRGL